MCDSSVFARYGEMRYRMLDVDLFCFFCFCLLFGSDDVTVAGQIVSRPRNDVRAFLDR